MGFLRFLSLSSVVASAVATGNLLVHKQLVTDPPMVFSTGSNFTVKFDIHNVGDSPAYDIAINDPWPATTQEGAEGFVLADGSMDFALEELRAGETKSWEFTMVPYFEGNFPGVRADITYLPSEDGELVRSRSSDPGRIVVYSAENYLKHFATYTREWFVFYLLSGASVLVPFAGWLLIQVRSPNGVPSSPLRKDE